MHMNMPGFFAGFGLIMFILYLGFIIYILYLFHTLAMSNKKISNTLEKISLQLNEHLKK
jgi:ABC-type Fe3+ transport system permease subunit